MKTSHEYVFLRTVPPSHVLVTCGTSQARWLGMLLISEWPTIDDVVDSPISLPWHVAMLPHGQGVQCNHGVFPKHQPYMLGGRSRNKNPQRFFRDWSLRNHGVLSLICWKWIWWIWRFKLKLSWWFQAFFYFHPKNWKRFPFCGAYFSDELVQPPRKELQPMDDRNDGNMRWHSFMTSLSLRSVARQPFVRKGFFVGMLTEKPQKNCRKSNLTASERVKEISQSHISRDDLNKSIPWVSMNVSMLHSNMGKFPNHKQLVFSHKSQGFRLDAVVLSALVSTLERGLRWSFTLQLLRPSAPVTGTPTPRGLTSSAAACAKQSEWTWALRLHTSGLSHKKTGWWKKMEKKMIKRSKTWGWCWWKRTFRV